MRQAWFMRATSWLAWLAALALVVVTRAAHAETVFGVVSERSAPRLLAGAEKFLAAHPEHRLVLRSRAQLAELTDAELVSLWRAADAVVIAGMHGPEAQRLVTLLERLPPRAEVPVVAFSGDLQLTRASRVGGNAVFVGLSESAVREVTAKAASERGPARDELARRYPRQARWLAAQGYWQANSPDNVSALFAWLLRERGTAIEVPPPAPLPPLRWFQDGREVSAPSLPPNPEGVVAIIDYDSAEDAGDHAVRRALCEQLERQQLTCVVALARWGQASVDALEALSKLPQGRLSSVVVLQDFVLGGGEGRTLATQWLERLGVPVLKAIRLVERTETAWRLSEDGLAHDSVHYQVAMPELQGASQPHVVAAAGAAAIDAKTGLAVAALRPVTEGLDAVARRLARWRTLQTKPNAEKRVAIVYYNHPPGRHNIGADNLDVPESLFEVLGLLGKAGYRVQDVPASSQALLERIQEAGINLPEDRGALRQLASRARVLDAGAYTRWFGTLPESLRREVVSGPLGSLLEVARANAEGKDGELKLQRVQRELADVRHLVEGVDHPARARALELLGQLEPLLKSRSLASRDVEHAERLVAALVKTGIEGLRGWGEPPGDVMVSGGALVIPGLEFGNVFIGPQPPRGWEVDEELLHANLAFSPPHQYLAYYHYLRDIWRADVVVHLGRHSTYEFLPGHRVGLTADDAPRVVLGDLPSVYVYIVDGVGEGIQAKRRGQAVIVDHLTPSLGTSPLYDALLEIRQLIETYEASSGRDSAAQQRAVAKIRQRIVELNLKEELVASMRDVLEVRGTSFERLDDELFVHEVGHYLTHVQEQFMPFGLHVFGRAWEPPAVARMLRSMAGEGPVDPAWRAALEASPRREAEGLLRGLSGRFIAPGPGNDPIRTPDAMPTGRNFHALDSSVIPTRLAFELGGELAAKARAEKSSSDGAEAVVLWASDTVRDEGAMVAFGLDLLGVSPRWNSRGIVTGLERSPLDGKRRARRDVTFVTSGLFRDLYGDLLVLLDTAARHALAGSGEVIRERHPALRAALDAALAPLGKDHPEGRELLEVNRVAAHWVADTTALVAQGVAAADAGLRASARVFGNAPGGYGAGVNRLAERSGAWDDRAEIARAYLGRMGHAYRAGAQGEPAHELFQRLLGRTEHTYLGRASNLYGLLDNNDGFDYLGGLGMAIESVRGEPPTGHVVDHSDPKQPRVDALPAALMAELRGRHFNPEYLKALMQHGYAGARTMGSEFMENLWGWQVTSPEIVKPWVWDEAKRIYIDDGHDLGLDEFLDSGQNVHVKTNLLAILLVAAQKGFWKPSEQVLRELAQQFAERVVKHGSPGSGHTRPDHPVYDFVEPHLDDALAEQLDAVMAAARREVGKNVDPSIIAELSENVTETPLWIRLVWGAAACAACGLIALGIRRGRTAS